MLPGLLFAGLTLAPQGPGVSIVRVAVYESLRGYQVLVYQERVVLRPGEKPQVFRREDGTYGVRILQEVLPMAITPRDRPHTDTITE